MDGEPSPVHVIRPLAQTVEQDGIDQADKEGESPVRVAHNEEQGGPFIPQHVKVQLVVHGDLPDFPDVKGRKPGSTANQYGFCCLARR